jgi:hypothetical protein
VEPCRHIDHESIEPDTNGVRHMNARGAERNTTALAEPPEPV